MRTVALLALMGLLVGGRQAAAADTTYALDAGRSSVVGTYDLKITGDLSLHGMTRSVELPLRVEVSGDTLKASGQLVLRQTEYGISPVSVAGVVKVKDELTIDYALVATKAIQ